MAAPEAPRDGLDHDRGDGVRAAAHDRVLELARGPSGLLGGRQAPADVGVRHGRDGVLARGSARRSRATCEPESESAPSVEPWNDGQREIRSVFRGVPRSCQ